jgi:hypothetical protein
MACACNLDFKRLQKSKAAKHWTDHNQKNKGTEIKGSHLRRTFMHVLLTCLELDLQSLFGLLCTAVLIGLDPVTTPLPLAFGLIYEGAIGQPRIDPFCNPLLTWF